MNENQKKILRILKLIFYFFAVILSAAFILKFFNIGGSDYFNGILNALEWTQFLILAIVVLVIGFVVLALIQTFFGKRSLTDNSASQASVLIKINAPNATLKSFIALLVAIGFAVLLNYILLSPDAVFVQGQTLEFGIFEKVLFGLFYVIAHFLVIVFGTRLVKGSPPVFVATEKGFHYEPAGIGSGWILWKDVTEARESAVFYGSTTTQTPVLVPVFGIKLRNPELQSKNAYSPLLQKLSGVAQKLNNYQTEGVGDILIKPSDLGKDYEKVKALFEEKVGQ
jgi:hypothetical protein